jgi:Family of unknown function (DUF6131)
MDGRIQRDRRLKRGSPHAAQGIGAAADRVSPGRPFPQHNWSDKMLILGLILLILGFLLGIPILWTIGIILLVVGGVLFLLGSVGRPVGGRRWYY